MASLAPSFEEYSEKYENVRMRREGGILELHLHTGGDSLVWSLQSHDELCYCFRDVACDLENEVVVLTGTGDVFCTEIDHESFGLSSPGDWAHAVFEGQQLMNNLLAIEVPVIGLINGPARVHPDIPVLSDITLATDTATVQDSPHFTQGLVPGDGSGTVWMHILGPQRGPYFLMTGQELDAQEALALGVVNEVLPRESALDRARELARDFAAKPRLSRRNTRALLTREWKRLMHEQLSLGFNYEAMGVLDLQAQAAE